MSIFYHDFGNPIPNSSCYIVAARTYQFIEEWPVDETGHYKTNLETNVLFPYGVTFWCHSLTESSIACEIQLNEDGTTRFVDLYEHSNLCGSGL